MLKLLVFHGVKLTPTRQFRETSVKKALANYPALHWLQQISIAGSRTHQEICTYSPAILMAPKDCEECAFKIFFFNVMVYGIIIKNNYYV